MVSEGPITKDVLVKTVTKILIPPIQLFGLYVIMHGHISPGGGFQGGVIIASSFILYALVFGYREGAHRAKLKIRQFLEPLGPIIFGTIGLICILFSGNFLQYSAIPILANAEIAATAISLVEIGIGITVTAVIFSIFMAMGGRKTDG
ncbi:sodium:proton antiporter [archaeon SCG-AAA382B04]|nr:sodium:proton antiporter [archaeon SCG-AAA382B04]